MLSRFWKNLIIFLLIFALFFSLYFFLRNIVYDSDDILYLLDAESGIKKDFDFWYSQHPLWKPLDVLIYETSRNLGNTGGALIPLQFTNSIFGALAVSVFFLSLYILTGNRVISLLAALLFGSSHYFWHWSGCVKHYSIAAFFIVLSLYFLVRLEKGGSLNALFAGFSAGLAALFHSANIIVFPIMILAVFIMKKPVIRNIINSLACITGLIIFFIIPHLFIMNYTSGIRIDNFAATISAHPMFGFRGEFPGFDPAVHFQRLPIFIDRSLRIMAGVYSYLGKSPLPYFLWKYFFSFILILTGFFFVFSSSRLFRERYPLLIFFLLWIIMGWVAMWLVDPFNPYIYVILFPVLAIFALSFCCFIERFKKIKAVQYSSVSLLSALLILLLYTNLVAAIIPSHLHNPAMQNVNHYRNIIKQDDTVISSGFDTDARYFEYFIRAKVITVVALYHDPQTVKSGNALNQLEAEINRALAGSGELYIQKDLLTEETEIPEWGTSNMNMKEISLFFKKNYIIKPIPGDNLGKYLILSKKKI